jgi:RNA polymerase sigma factor (sigma-70 family)
MTETRRRDNEALFDTFARARASAAASPTTTNRRAVLAAQNAIVVDNMGAIGSIAKRYARRASSMQFEDLVHEGVFGFVRSLETFDPTRGIALITYARHWVHSYIRRAMDWQERLVRFPSREEQRHRAMLTRSSKARNLTGREFTVDEVAESLGVNQRRAGMVMSMQLGLPVSLDKSVGGEDGGVGHTIGDMLPDTSPDPFQNLETHEREKIASALLASLPTKERYVMEHRMRGLTLDEIGRGLGFTRERARQIESDAIGHMQVTAKYNMGLGHMLPEGRQEMKSNSLRMRNRARKTHDNE